MENTLEKLAQAADGLLYMSETDSPFETVEFSNEILPELRPDAVVTAVGKTAGTPVQTQDLGFFLRNQTRELPGFSPDDKARAQRFRDLEQLLKQKLKDVEVFRIGEIQITAYILGHLPDGKIGGLKTLLVET